MIPREPTQDYCKHGVDKRYFCIACADTAAAPAAPTRTVQEIIGDPRVCVTVTPKTPAPATPAPEIAPHDDDLGVDRFAAAMKAKLAEKRAEGYGGWNDADKCPPGRLAQLLHDHLAKGDPLDIGNFAMMLWNRGELCALPATAAPVPDGDYTSAEAVAKTVAKLTDWAWLAEYANAGWQLPPKGTEALAMLAGRAAAQLAAQAAQIANLRAQLAEAQDHALRMARGAMQAEGRSERAEAERDKLRECVKAADAMRERVAIYGWHDTTDDQLIGNVYDAARAKVEIQPQSGRLPDTTKE